MNLPSISVAFLQVLSHSNIPLLHRSSSMTKCFFSSKRNICVISTWNRQGPMKAPTLGWRSMRLEFSQAIALMLLVKISIFSHQWKGHKWNQNQPTLPLLKVFGVILQLPVLGVVRQLEWHSNGNQAPYPWRHQYSDGCLSRSCTMLEYDWGSYPISLCIGVGQREREKEK